MVQARFMIRLSWSSERIEEVFTEGGAWSLSFLSTLFPEANSLLEIEGWTIYKETQGALVLPLGSQERQGDDNNWHSQSFQATPCSVDFTWFNSFNSATTIRWAAIMIYVLKQGKRRSWEVEWLTHSRTTSKHQYWDLTPGTLVPEPGLGSTMLYATPAS